MLAGSVRQILGGFQHMTNSIRHTSKYTGTYVVQRETAPYLSDRSHPAGTFRRLRRKHSVYQLVDRPATQPLPKIDLILTQYVDGLGRPGDKVSVQVNKAHRELLATSRAVYASPENIEKYRELAATAAASDQPQHSSIHSATTAKLLRTFLLAVCMNMEEPWTIQPWHIRMNFRKAGFVVPEHCIEMPQRQISGPDLENLQDREFVVTVTINDCERVPVRCRIHHYPTSPRHTLPFRDRFWLRPAEPVFEEDRDQLAQMPRPDGQLVTDEADDEY